MMRSFLITLLAMVAVSSAFVAPSQRARVVAAASPTAFVLKMSEKPDASKEGTFYDDEVDPTPNKPAISDAMKARLIKEASAGLDSEKPQTNVILYISLAVAVLVILGGQGVFY